MGGRLVALLAMTMVLLASSTGNSFSMHVGMTMKSSATGVAQSDHMAGPVAGEASAVAEAARAPLADAPEPIVPTSSDAHHLMHLVGACLALLATAALLLPLLLLGRILDLRHSAAVTAPRLVSMLTPPSWTPPTLNPPTSSPVIRT